jgi:dTDP-glucose pyrophosphorylase/CBS domain-containing protein
MISISRQTRLESVVVSSSLSIGEAIARLDKAGTGAVALCGENRKLVGLLTDGDIRRAILRSVTLDNLCGSISNSQPIAALEPVDSAEALRLMNQHDIHQLPVVNADGMLVDFLLRRDLSQESEFESTTERRLESVVISPDTTIAEAIAQLDKAGTGVLLLCQSDRILRGVITDGDIRRAILLGKPMEAPCSTIASKEPVVASHSIPMAEALRLMNQHDINQLPVVDAENHVVELLLRKDLVTDVQLDLPAVVMAGGYGKRLLPLTESVPKPMLPVGDRPLLELIIQQLHRAGIRDVNLTTHYLPDSILNHFGTGKDFGVSLNYSKEDHPMGTAGGLKLMKRPESSFLVINGDILTGLPFQEMLMYHRKHGADLTVGVRKYDMQVPFGVVECDGVRITGIREKPSMSFFINAGTYLLEPSACDYIPDGRPFDMTDLIQKLLETGKTVVAFPIMEYWIDVGRHEDYQKAQEFALKGRLK